MIRGDATGTPRGRHGDATDLARRVIGTTPATAARSFPAQPSARLILYETPFADSPQARMKTLRVVAVMSSAVETSRFGKPAMGGCLDMTNAGSGGVANAIVENPG